MEDEYIGNVSYKARDPRGRAAWCIAGLKCPNPRCKYKYGYRCTIHVITWYQTRCCAGRIHRRGELTLKNIAKSFIDVRKLEIVYGYIFWRVRGLLCIWQLYLWNATVLLICYGVEAGLDIGVDLDSAALHWKCLVANCFYGINFSLYLANLYTIYGCSVHNM